MASARRRGRPRRAARPRARRARAGGAGGRRGGLAWAPVGEGAGLGELRGRVLDELERQRRAGGDRLDGVLAVGEVQHPHERALLVLLVAGDAGADLAVEPAPTELRLAMRARGYEDTLALQLLRQLEERGERVRERLRTDDGEVVG